MQGYCINKKYERAIATLLLICMLLTSFPPSVFAISDEAPVVETAVPVPPPVSDPIIIDAPIENPETPTEPTSDPTTVPDPNTPVVPDQTQDLPPRLPTTVAPRPDALPEDTDTPEKAESLIKESSLSAPPAGMPGASNTVLGSRISNPTVDKLTGALAQQYQIFAPQGRAGLTPSVSLQYKSNSTDNFSIVGYGWNISIPKIERINKLGVDNLYNTDYFASSEAGELASSSASNTLTTGTYTPKFSSGEVQKYEFSGNVWTVKNSSGITFTYGASEASREFDSTNPSHTSSWYLSSITDANGNTISYEYEKDAGKLYPKNISYSDIYNIEFQKESRPDNMVSYATGYGITTNFRINKIITKVNNTSAREYAISYTSGVNTARSLISNITETGIASDGTRTTMSPTVFEYENSPVSFVYDSKYDNMVLESNKVTFITDIDGNGYQDKFNENGSMINFPNGPRGWGNTLGLFTLFGYYPYFQPGNANARPQYVRMAGERFIDLNNDQRPDLFWSRVMSNARDNQPQNSNYSEAGLRLNTSCGGDVCQYLSDTSFSQTANLPTIDIQTPLSEPFNTVATFANLDGDPFPDSLQYINNSTSKGVPYGVTDKSGYFSLPDDFKMTKDPISQNFSFNAADVVATDFNGDGLDDIVTPTNSKRFINTGNPTLATSTWQSTPNWVFWGSRGFTGTAVMTDLNSDGLTDFISRIDDPDGRYGNFNKGTDFATQTTVHPKLTEHGCDGYYDVNGDGMTDCPPYINQAKKPDILKKISYPTGSITTVEYEPTPQQVDATGKQKHPLLPSVFYTVKKITNDAGNGLFNTSSYSYVGGKNYQDGPYEHKFAGFSSITETQSDGTYSTTYFHQGDGQDSATFEPADSVALIGAPYESDTYDSSGKLLARNRLEYSVIDRGFGAYSVYQKDSISTEYGSVTGTEKSSALRTEYNTEVGLPVRKISFGNVTLNPDMTFTDIGLDQIETLYTYATSSNNKMFRISKEESFDVSNKESYPYKLNTISHLMYYYDNSGYGILTQGNITRSRIFYSPYSYYGIETFYTYDTKGNVLSETKMDWNTPYTTSYTYDSNNIFPIKSTNALGQETTFEYDYTCGKIKKSTSPNGFISQTSYDGFCRPIRSESTDINGVVSLNAEYSYIDTPGNISKSSKQYLNATQFATKTAYFDNFGREIQSKTQAESPNFVTLDIVYDTMGRVQKQSLPYFTQTTSKTPATTNANLFIENTYDALSRVVKTKNAIGESLNDYSIPRSVTTTDPMGKKKTLVKDAYGNLIKVIENNAGVQYVTSYEWNPAGKLTKITDALGNVRNFTYDLVGRQLTASDIKNSSTGTGNGDYIYKYNELGNLTESISPRGVVTKYFYDALSRLYWKTVRNSDYVTESEVRYTYDTCKYSTGTNNPCSVTRTDSNLQTYSENNIYYPNSQINIQSKDISGELFSTKYSYDRTGNLVSEIASDRSETSYIYGPEGLLQSITRKNVPVASSTPIIANIDYAPTSAKTLIEYGNGTATTNIYDENALYRLRSKVTKGPKPADPAPVAMSGYVAPIAIEVKTLEPNTTIVGKTKTGSNIYKKVIQAKSDIATSTKSTNFSIKLDKKVNSEMIKISSGSSTISIGPVNTNSSAQSKNKNTSLYKNTFDKNIDLEIITSNSGVEKNVLIQNKPAVSSKINAKSKLTYLEFPFKISGSNGVDLLIDGKLLSKEKTITSSSSATIITKFGEKLSISQTFASDSSKDKYSQTKSINLAVRYEYKKDGIYATKLIPVEWLRMATYPVRADITFVESSSGTTDGRIRTCYRPYDAFGWSCRDTSDGDYIDYTSSAMDMTSDNSFVYRAFMAFDTKSVPANANIISAKLVTTQVSFHNEIKDAFNTINVYQSFQASSTQLRTTDIAKCGDKLTNPTKGSTDISINTLTNNNLKPINMELGTTGLSWIKKGDYTNLCMREGHDATDTKPSYWNTSGVEIFTSRATDLASRPRLEITYSLSAKPDSPTDIRFDGVSSPIQNSTFLPKEISAIYSNTEQRDPATAYQVQASSDQSFANIIWDSTKVSLASSTLPGQIIKMPFTGPASLTSYNKVYFRVRFIESENLVGDWSSGADYVSFIKEYVDIQSVSYQYDKNGNITKITNSPYVGTKKIDSYTYDDLNRLISASSNETGTTTENRYTQTWTYSPINNILTNNLATTNGEINKSYSYLSTNAHAPSSILISTRSGTTTLSNTATYSYDLDGNTTKIANSDGTQIKYDWTVRNELSKITDQNTVSKYQYDHTGTRTKSSVTKDTKTSETFYPNKNLNLARKAGVATMTSHIFLGDTPIATYATPETKLKPDMDGDNVVNFSDLVRVSQNYEANASPIDGDVTLDGIVNFDDLVSVSQNYEATTTPTPTASSTLSFIHPDHLGGSSVITDNTGYITESTEYLPYGDIFSNSNVGTAPSEQRKFTGHEYDSESDLTYMGARYYNAKSGQFLNEDPNFWTDLNLSDPQSFNAYAYARNNPIMYRDPDGRGIMSWLGNFFGGIFGGSVAPKGTNGANGIANSTPASNSSPKVSVSSPSGLNMTTFGSISSPYRNNTIDGPRNFSTWDSVSSSRISQLNPAIQQQAASFINRVESALGQKIRITESYRTGKLQNDYYARSRTQRDLDMVGLNNVQAKPDLPWATNAIAGKSYHNHHRAIDVVRINDDGTADWTPITQDVANYAIEQGFVWGANFGDSPHFEMSLGQSVDELYKTYSYDE